MSISSKTIIKKPTIALVGRTNVGKSTLFNRLIEESKAIVSAIPGTTRSSNYGESIWRGSILEIIDTGGLERRTKDPFMDAIREQVKKALEDADVILFMIDLRTGIMPLDREVAKYLAGTKKAIILVGNKAERKDARDEAMRASWAALGFGAVVPISAATGMGVGDLLDLVFDELQKQHIEPPTIEEERHPIRVAIIGKPNVGKSSLLNALVGSQRAIVSEIAHTTREPQDTLVRINDTLYLFIDTAGIRKQARHGLGLESTGIQKSFDVIRRADIALFVLDLASDIGAQDRYLAGLLNDAKVGIVVVANKWDLMPDKKSDTPTRTRELLSGNFPFMQWAPIEFVSAKTKERVEKLFSLITTIFENRKREITDSALDRFFRSAIREHRPARGKGVKHPYIYDMKQTSSTPPTFMISVKGRRDSIHPSYLRFLENRLRDYFHFEGTPITIHSKAIRPHV